MASGTITKILKLKDEASRPLIKAALAAERAAKAMSDLDSDVEGLEDALSDLDKEADAAADALDDTASSAAKVSSKSKSASKDSGKLGDTLGGPVLKGLKMAGAAAMALGAGFAALGVSAIGVAADMERYEAQLSTILKSSGAAKERLAELFEIGSTTPFELEALVRADTVLESFGANAADLRLGVMDLAGALGGELPDAAMAVAKSYGAGKAASDGLRESYALLFNDIVERANKMGDPADINVWRAAMTEALNDVNGVVAGGTAKLAATFQGQLSNMSDAWFKFRKEVADAGLFSHAKATMSVLLEQIEASKNTTADWAQLISDRIIDGFQGVAIVIDAVSQAVIGTIQLALIFENAVRSIGQIWNDLIVVIGQVGVAIAELDVLMGGAFSGEGAERAEAKLREYESSLHDAKVAALESAGAIHQNRVAISELSIKAKEVHSIVGLFDDIAERAGMLEDALQIEANVNVNMTGQADLLEALGFGGQSRDFGTVKVVGPKKRSRRPRGTSKGTDAGSKELSGLTGQVESFTKQMFPISRMEAANRLIAELHAAQDRASGTRRAAFAELITQAEAARRALGAAGLASDMDSLAKSLDATSKSLDSVGELAQAAAADLEAAAAAQLEAASAALQVGISAATDVGGVVSTLGPAGGALSALSGLGGEASAAGKQAKDAAIEAALEAGATAAEARAAGKRAEAGGLEDIVEANVEGFIKGFEVLITQLPGVISNTIPRILGEMIPDLIVSLVENAPAIAKAFLIDLPIALSEAFGKAFARIWDAIKDFFSKLLGFEEFSDKTKDTFHALTLGLFEGKQTGGMIDRTGLFMLHQNERVIPSSGAAPQGARGMMGGGGGGVNITINTNVVDPNSIDQLGRMLQRHFGSMGRSTLPIFGGG